MKIYIPEKNNYSKEEEEKVQHLNFIKNEMQIDISNLDSN